MPVFMDTISVSFKQGHLNTDRCCHRNVWNVGRFIVFTKFKIL